MFFEVQPWFITNGTSILNKDWTASNMLDPKVSETLQFLYDLIHVSKVSPIPGPSDLDNQFLAGQIAMNARGLRVVQNVKTSGLDIDIAPVPAKENDHTVVGFGGYALSNNSPNKALAWALIQELTTAQTEIAEGELGGAIPGRKSASDTPEFLAYPPNAKLYYETLASTEAVTAPPNYVDLQQIFVRYYLAMMSGDMTIADGVKAADTEINDSFARLKANN